ncbi:MAG: DUF2804 family protein, partial [Termitinemataceae bacterium]
MQQEITTPYPLLNPAGHITVEGWARYPYWEYRRRDIKASPFRIKEWDYYMIFSHKHRFGISFTISDLGYLGLGAICFFDFNRAYYHQIDAMKLLPLGRMGLPVSSNTEAEISFSAKNLSIIYTFHNGKRSIHCTCPDIQDSLGNKGLSGTIFL